MKNPRINLADSSQCDRFIRMLDQVEKRDASSNGILSNWEREFVVDIREKFNAREDQIDMGMTPWNPTTSQWNTLHGIWSAL